VSRRSRVPFDHRLKQDPRCLPIHPPRRHQRGPLGRNGGAHGGDLREARRAGEQRGGPDVRSHRLASSNFQAGSMTRRDRRVCRRCRAPTVRAISIVIFRAACPALYSAAPSASSVHSWGSCRGVPGGGGCSHDRGVPCAGTDGCCGVKSLPLPRLRRRRMSGSTRRCC
jgi:hypothetical protein